MTATDAAGTARMPHLVTPASVSRRLAQLDSHQTVALLAEHGAMLFRGFEPSVEDFSTFVTAHSARVTLDPARTFHGGTVAQMVDAGTAAVGLHVENGNSPFAPDLTWFCCVRAARRGSQTTLCDGYRVWDALSEPARKAFVEQPITYTRRVEEARWMAFARHHRAAASPADDVTAEVTVDDLKALSGNPTATSIDAHPDGSITYRYRTPAAHGTLFGDRWAWANSILGPSYNYEAPRITFADGSEIPPALLGEVADVSAALTEDVEWADGDVLLVDNTRVMHGRRAIEDPQRTIYNAQSDIDRSLLPRPSGVGSDGKGR